MVSPCGANLGIYKDWQLLFQDLIVVKNRKKLIFHLNTISPSGNKLFDSLVKFLCKRSCVYVREKNSQQYLESKGILAKWGPDSAFMLESEGKIQYEEKRITFVPSDVWSWHVDFIGGNLDSYDEMIVKPLAQFAQKHNKEICILMHTNYEDEKAFNEKTKLKLEKVAPGLKVVIPEVKSVYDYENYIRSSYMVVGMRYHSIVLAAKNAIPFVAISYEQKIKEVSSYTEQSYYCLDLKNIYNEKPLIAILEKANDNHNKIKEELEELQHQIKEQASIVIKEQVLLG